MPDTTPKSPFPTTIEDVRSSNPEPTKTNSQIKTAVICIGAAALAGFCAVLLGVLAYEVKSIALNPED